jgi:hypothetical protein
MLGAAADELRMTRKLRSLGPTPMALLCLENCQL